MLNFLLQVVWRKRKEREHEKRVNPHNEGKTPHGKRYCKIHVENIIDDG